VPTLTPPARAAWDRIQPMAAGSIPTSAQSTPLRALSSRRLERGVRRDPMREVDLLLLMEDEMTRRNDATNKQASALPLVCLLALLLTLVGTLAHAVGTREHQSGATLSSLDHAFGVFGPLTLQAP
jgi:hypothetical protein